MPASEQSLRAEVALAERSGQPGHDNMAWIRGGTFRMGSDHHYPEERPTHSVRVDSFWMDRHAVTNAQFARFVTETCHVGFRCDA